MMINTYLNLEKIGLKNLKRNKMTLKEKFEQYAKKEVWEKKNYNAEECEQIADDYAIGFAEWLFNIDIKALKKQLNHFKEEKGL